MKEEVVGEGEGGKRGSGRKRRGGRLIQSRNSERGGFSALSATARCGGGGGGGGGGGRFIPEEKEGQEGGNVRKGRTRSRSGLAISRKGGTVV